MSLFRANIARIPSGFLNAGSDAVIGMSVAPAVTGASQFAGQLGSFIELTDSGALQLSNLAVGTLFGGVYQYVKFAAGDPTWKRGQTCFWDLSVAASTMQVTVTEANAGAGGAIKVAGQILHPNTGTPGALTPGGFGWVQVLGRASVLFRAVLTAAGAIGSPVFAAAAGAGADNATADVIASAVGTTFTSVGQMLERYIGIGEAAPVGGAISIVELSPRPFRIAA